MEGYESNSPFLHREQPTPSELSLFEEGICTQSIDENDNVYQWDSPFLTQEKYPLFKESLFEIEIPTPGEF